MSRAKGSIWDTEVENEQEWQALAHLRGWTHMFSVCPLCQADPLTSGEGLAEVLADATGELFIACPRTQECDWQAHIDKPQVTLFDLVLELRKHVKSAHPKNVTKP